MDDSRTVFARLEAENLIQGWLQKHRPTLIVRCLENKTNVYVVTGMAANPEYGTDRHSVRIRFGEGPAYRERWSQSTDNKALFAPKPISLARKIAGAQILLFEFTPFNANPAIARFDVRGFGEHLNTVAEPCGWDEATLARKRKEEQEAIASVLQLAQATLHEASKAVNSVTFDEMQGRVCTMKRDSFHKTWSSSYYEIVKLLRRDELPDSGKDKVREELNKLISVLDKKRKECTAKLRGEN